jgi:hypothetical protein
MFRTSEMDTHLPTSNLARVRVNERMARLDDPARPQPALEILGADAANRANE